MARAFDYNKIILLCSWIKFYLQWGKMSKKKIPFFFLDINGYRRQTHSHTQGRQKWYWGQEMYKIFGMEHFFLVLDFIFLSITFRVAVCLWCVIWIGRNINWSTWILLNLFGVVEHTHTHRETVEYHFEMFNKNFRLTLNVRCHSHDISSWWLDKNTVSKRVNFLCEMPKIKDEKQFKYLVLLKIVLKLKRYLFERNVGGSKTTVIQVFSSFSYMAFSYHSNKRWGYN